ncbi:uncharacterized protein LOC115222292 [Octopus sinensis]|uniref:NADH dehydrogenase [ubiquinone] 1 beta subcomplex subunit 4 n=1 Tax=Octopus sinensis TaxID=2607531 RepID=A0A6P7TG18_9MOLL|nr:uncharacterized protein LOC115222292 [Octopus sinensis]
MTGVIKKTWDPWKMYDVSLKERKAMEERALMREKLKGEWQKKVTDPYKGTGGYIFDPQMQRFYSMRVTGFNYFKVSFKSVMVGLNFVVVPIAVFTYLIYKEREGQERKIRNGEIMYKDRHNKLI